MADWDNELVHKLIEENCKRALNEPLVKEHGAPHCSEMSHCEYKKGKFCKRFWGMYFESVERKERGRVMEKKEEVQQEVAEASQAAVPAVITEGKSVIPSLTQIEAIERIGAKLEEAGALPTGVNALQAFAIIQTGAELGYAPMQSLRMFAFIKGKIAPLVQGELAQAVRAGLRVIDIQESNTEATVTVERFGRQYQATFTVEDAKRAKLIYAGSAWEKYPNQMLVWRAFGIVLRRAAPDAILGLLPIEEVEGIDQTPTRLTEEQVQEAKKEIYEYADKVSKPAKARVVEKDERATDTQKEAIDILFRQAEDLGMTDERFATILAEEYRASDTGDLTVQYADDCIDRLNKYIAAKQTSRKHKAAGTPEREVDEPPEG